MDEPIRVVTKEGRSTDRDRERDLLNSQWVAACEWGEHRSHRCENEVSDSEVRADASLTDSSEASTRGS